MMEEDLKIRIKQIRKVNRIPPVNNNKIRSEITKQLIEVTRDMKVGDIVEVELSEKYKGNNLKTYVMTAGRHVGGLFTSHIRGNCVYVKRVK